MTPLTDSILSLRTTSSKRPRTLADAMSIIERSNAAIPSPSRAQRRLVSVLRTVSNRVSEILELPAQAIDLDSLVEIDALLVEYVEGRGIDHQSAVQYTCDLHKLLDLAHAAGWTSPAFELRKAWRSIRAAFKGDTMGCGSIIRHAIRLECLPRDFTEEAMESWRQRFLNKGQSLGSAIRTESHFRRVLRAAGLQHLFPRFSFAIKMPTSYCLKFEDLPKPLQNEILTVVGWKTADVNLADRNAKLLIRPVTAEHIQHSFRELYSYAVVIQGLRGITHLPQLITKPIVCSFVDWLLANKRCKPQSVIAKLSGICFLTATYPGLKGPDYSWFRAKLRGLRKEAPGRIQRRKLDALPDYPSVAEIASRILALRQGPRPLTELEAAWATHDALLLFMLNSTPHRSRNTCELRSHKRRRLNLFETEISDELVTQFKFPAWAKEIRDKDPGTKFLVGHWLESATKAGHEVWEVLSNEVRDLFREYMDYYRPILLRALNPDNEDSTRVFFARSGKPLSQRSLLDLVARLSVRFTNKRMRVKDFRDLFAAHMLFSGASVEEIANCLWHVDPFSCSTTVRYYIAGYNASHGTVALEEEIAHLMR